MDRKMRPGKTNLTTLSPSHPSPGEDTTPDRLGVGILGPHHAGTTGKCISYADIPRLLSTRFFHVLMFAVLRGRDRTPPRR